MNSQKNLWVALVAVGIIAIAGLWLSVGHVTPTDHPAGSTTSQCNGGNCTTFTAVQTTAGYWTGATKVIDSAGAIIAATFTQGGGITASSTSASVTLAGTEFVTSNVFDYTVNVGSPTLTLNASTSPPCSVMSAGQVRTLYIHNATTTAASQITVAGGTGVILGVSSTTVIAGSTTGKGFARLDVTKKANTDCQALMTNFD